MLKPQKYREIGACLTRKPDVLSAFLLFAAMSSLAGCADPEEYDQESPTDDARNFIAVMDRVTEEYAMCWAYFDLGSDFPGDRAKTARQIAQIAGRASMEKDAAFHWARDRHNYYVRVMTGYFEGVEKDWVDIENEYGARCRSAISNVSGTVAGLANNDK